MLTRSPNPYQKFAEECAAVRAEMMRDAVPKSTARVQAHRKRNAGSTARNRLRCWRVYLFDETISEIVARDIDATLGHGRAMGEREYAEAVSRALRLRIEASVTTRRK